MSLTHDPPAWKVGRMLPPDDMPRLQFDPDSDEAHIEDLKDLVGAARDAMNHLAALPDEVPFEAAAEAVDKVLRMAEQHDGPAVRRLVGELRRLRPTLYCAVNDPQDALHALGAVGYPELRPPEATP